MPAFAQFIWNFVFLALFHQLQKAQLSLLYAAQLTDLDVQKAQLVTFHAGWDYDVFQVLCCSKQS